jgi:regulator of protease activity HflC (stomatin/prohibitin superfamily)
MADIAVPGNTLRLNVISTAIFIFSVALAVIVGIQTRRAIPPIVILLAGFVLMQSPRVAQQWERGIVLRLGRFVGLRGPGLFWVVPFVDSVSSWIDQRTITTGFAAEQTLTSDTVPVNVDAVLFWMVHDAEKAASEVQN